MFNSLSMLVHWFVSGGLVMYPLLLLSLISVAIAVERFHYFNIRCKGFRKMLIGVEHAVRCNHWEAIAECCECSSCFGRVIEEGLNSGRTELEIRNILNERMSIEMAGFKKYLDYLSAIVTIAPLLGLLGTVTGMISTFGVLGAGGGVSSVTGGVGEALIATATGLCVALTAFVCYTYFSHRIDSIVNAMEKVCILIVYERKKWWSESCSQPAE